VTGTRPDRVLDPVCGMGVDVDHAESAGLTVEHESRIYAFCRGGCLRAFLEEPAVYAARSEAAAAPTTPEQGSAPVIDEGMRRWYESCACCLSDAYPEVKAALDAERATEARPPAGPGICEVAEAQEAQEVTAS
jgi:YHS domain-containing protein